MVHDRLGCEEILAELPPSIRRIDVGKRPGGTGRKQADIQATLLGEAQDGNVVVRLKGGDPFVFGRGMEELAALTEAGIPVRVVPGVTSALAGPLAAGIPVTHRDLARSFAVATARTSGGDLPDLPSADTHVFLMGIAALGSVVEALLARGTAAATPAAVVSNATTYRERLVVATLETIESEVAKAGLEAPAILVVGEVARFARPACDDRPVLVTASRIPSSFHDLFPGRTALWRPLASMEPLVPVDRGALECTLGLDWLVLNSPRAAEGYLAQLRAAVLDLRALKAKIAVVGEEPAGVLARAGIFPEAVLADGDREELSIRLGNLVTVRHVGLLAAEGYAGRLVKDIEAAGAASLAVHATYRLRPREATEPDWRFVEDVLFASPGNVRRFAEMWPAAPVSRLRAHVIGPSTRHAAAETGFIAINDVCAPRLPVFRVTPRGQADTG